MTLLLAFIARPELRCRSRGNRFSCCPRRSEAISVAKWEIWPRNSGEHILRHMIGATTTVALDWRQGGGIQRPARGRGSGRKTTTTRTTRASTGDMANTTTVLHLESGKISEIVICITSHIALRTPALLDPQTGALRWKARSWWDCLSKMRKYCTLDMSNSTTWIALFGRNSARRGASRRLVSRLATVVTQTLLRGAIFGNVSDWPEKFYIRTLWSKSELEDTHDFHTWNNLS